MQCQKVLKCKHSDGMCQGNIEPTKRTNNCQFWEKLSSKIVLHYILKYKINIQYMLTNN